MRAELLDVASEAIMVRGHGWTRSFLECRRREPLRLATR